MLEKRKHQRMPLKLEIMISELFKQDYELLYDINSSIEIRDISKTGIGFYCNHELPLGYYFDAKIQLPNKHFFTVLKITRVTKLENRYNIGCEFIGLGEILSKSIDEYYDELKNE